MELEEVSLDVIYDFIENGDPENADSGVVDYLELMDKVRGMYLRFDRWGSKEAILKHLMKVEKLSRYLASKLYNDTLEYFYCDNEISKDAWRNILADKMEKTINMAIMMIQDTSDADRVTKMIQRLAYLRRLDKDDPEELPEEWFQKPWKLYAMDAKFLGLPEVNRQELAKQIDTLPELSEKERELIKREAAVLPIKLFLDEQEDARKS